MTKYVPTGRPRGRPPGVSTKPASERERILREALHMKFEPVHFWGVINGERRVVACHDNPVPTWRTTGSIILVSCTDCLMLLKASRRERIQ